MLHATSIMTNDAMLNCLMIQQSHFWAYIQRDESRYIQDTCTPMLNTALFITASMWKPARHPSADEQMKMAECVYSGILFSHGKEGNPVICNNMEGP